MQIDLPTPPSTASAFSFFGRRLQPFITPSPTRMELRLPTLRSQQILIARWSLVTPTRMELRLPTLRSHQTLIARWNLVKWFFGNTVQRPTHVGFELQTSEPTLLLVVASEGTTRPPWWPAYLLYFYHWSGFTVAPQNLSLTKSPVLKPTPSRPYLLKYGPRYHPDVIIRYSPSQTKTLMPMHFS